MSSSRGDRPITDRSNDRRRVEEIVTSEDRIAGLRARSSLRGFLTTKLAQARTAGARAVTAVAEHRLLRFVRSFVRAIARRFTDSAAKLRPGWLPGWRVRPIPEGSFYKPEIPDEPSAADPAAMPETEPGLGTIGPQPTRIYRPGARRRTDRPKAGHCMWLDIDRLIGQGILQPGSRRQGAIAWRDTIACEYTTVDRARRRTGEYVCSVGFDADLEEPATTTVRLCYCVHDPATGNLRAVDQLVGMAWIYGELWFVDNGRRSKR